jgi:type II secretory pathway component PulF
VNKRRASEFFIEFLSEISLSRIPVLPAISHIAQMRGIPRAVSRIAFDIAALLEQGYTFSAAFSMCKSAQFSEKDISLVLCAEETGNYGSTFKFLSEIHAQEKEARSKIALCAVYPAFVILLAACATLALMLNAESLFPFSKQLLNSADYAASFKQGIAAACFVPLAAIGCLTFASARFIKFPALYYVYAQLDFLTKEGVELSRAIESAISAAISDEKLSSALTRIKDALKSGVPFAEAFLSEKIFDSARVFIETASANGTARTVFSLAARQRQKQRQTREQFFLKMVEPVMLIAAGAYMLILLRHTVMPLMMNLGGFM